ncbi:MAG: bacillithiol biosynthesis cysteine-adding enzyme BshC [Bacteroidota bacterium]
MEWIDLRSIPPSLGGFSALFCDYLYDFNAVRNFYAWDFRDPRSFDRLLETLRERDYRRPRLVAALRRQNEGSGAEPGASLDLLEQPTTFAVVTGQQVGLFGGPLYTIYKTITAIKLAEQLKVRYPACDFVPVFWLEGEDHDYDEVRALQLPGPEGDVATIRYGGEGSPGERNGPVGEIRFGSELAAVYAELEKILPATEFTAGLLEGLRSCYREGVTFSRAFALWMGRLFGRYGLVCASPNDPALKALASPLLEAEITGYPRTSQLVIARSAELEQSYHAQVKPRPLNLFLFHKGGRYPIEPREHDFSLRGTRHFIPREELLRMVRETPEVFSPNVVLRPLLQDTLFPTIAYVAGPSEIAYHAQLLPVYEEFGVAPPVLFPRMTATLVEERVRRMAEKYQLPLAALFDGADAVRAKVLEAVQDVDVEALFGEATRSVHSVLGEMRFGIGEVDPTLLGTLDGVRAKFDISLGVLREKVHTAQKRRHETALRQVERALGAFLPGGVLQERAINPVFYLNKYGPDLIQWLMGEADISAHKHHILTL